MKFTLRPNAEINHKWRAGKARKYFSEFVVLFKFYFCSQNSSVQEGKLPDIQQTQLFYTLGEYSVDQKY
jgi:hypothetical protein